MSTDAIVVLKEDHKQLRRLYLEDQWFPQVREGAQPSALKKTIDAVIS